MPSQLFTKILILPLAFFFQCFLLLEIVYTSLKFPFYHLQSPILLPYVKTSP